jgi:DHA1 family bicyclomycin/chloramphenicol resistance-like MFS transporter
MSPVEPRVLTADRRHVCWLSPVRSTVRIRDALTRQCQSRPVTSDRIRAPHGLSRTAIITLGLLSAFGPLSMDLYLPALPAIATDFRVPDSAVQWTLSTSLIGLGAGQLVFGPLSDRYGRRVPLLTSLVGFTLASVLCFVAPNLWFLILARLLQGFCGAGGVVLARATVRDRCPPEILAHVYSRLTLVFAVAPVLGPLIGSVLLQAVSWRGIFGFLTAVGVLLTILAMRALPESLPPERRHADGFAAMARAWHTLRQDRRFVGACVLLSIGGMGFFTYLALGSLVFQDELGLSPAMFALVYGMNSLALAVVGQLAARLVHRFALENILGLALTMMAIASCLLAVSMTAGWGLPGLLPPLVFAVAGIGALTPTGTAIAMSGHASHAGMAAALLGCLSCAVGAIPAPIASVTGTSGRAMTMTMAVWAVLAVLAWVAFFGPRRVPRPVGLTAAETG